MNTSIYSYWETSGGQGSDLYLNDTYGTLRQLFSCIGGYIASFFPGQSIFMNKARSLPILCDCKMLHLYRLLNAKLPLK